MAIIGIITTMLVGALADRPDPSRELMLYLDEDTKIPYVCDGTAWHPIGGGGGGGYPDVAADGLTPGGLIVGGAVTVGDANATDLPTIHRIYGQLIAQDSPGNRQDGDPVLMVYQTVDQQADASSLQAIQVERAGSTQFGDYAAPMVTIRDTSNSTQPLARFTKGAVTQMQVDTDGVRVHGKFKTGASAAHTLGSYSGNAVPVYDESGTILGWAPLYN